MFTQCEDINCRSVAPVQDTPANRITYGACITTNSTLTPYMSANRTGQYIAQYGYYKTCYYNEIPIPNYLMALAVGQLEYASTGYRTGVITEPSLMSSVLEELSDLESFLDTAEEYIQTPYIWGNYTVIVLPPSFPMGGMENPLLTFASPTIIVGDKS